MTNYQFQNYLRNNVVEAYVSRRHKKNGWSPTRGIYATANKNILNSLEGLRAFGFVPPGGIGMSYDPMEKNCVVAWDIFKGDFRVFSMTKGANIKNAYPVNNKVNILKFWDHFTNYVLLLSPEDKLRFMGLINI